MKTNQADRAYEAVREQLLAGSLAPGSRLAEQSFGERLGVNRGDVREALARLFSEELVTRGARGGYFVRDYSPEDRREINELRLILESAAARLALERATAEDIRALEDTADHMRLMAEHGYLMGLAEADVRFHDLLVRAAHNGRLARAYRQSNIPLTGIPGPAAAAGREQLLRDAREHRRIVECLRERESEELLALLGRGM
jgi:DNA-binding GntR family transcriptional regulator